KGRSSDTPRSAMGGRTQRTWNVDRPALCAGRTPPAGGGLPARLTEPGGAQKQLAISRRGRRSHALWTTTFVRTCQVGRRHGAGRPAGIRSGALSPTVVLEIYLPL